MHIIVQQSTGIRKLTTSKLNRGKMWP